MTDLLGTVRRGDDVTFRGITVRVAGNPQDLTATGWAVAAQLRLWPDDPAHVELGIDVAALAASRIVLSLTRAQTAGMEPGVWFGDVEITGPGGRRSSPTFTVLVEPDITRSVAP